MADYSDKIKELEDELQKTKYNKRTQHHIGLVKAKIASLKEKQSSGGGRKGEGFTVKKSGDATVVMLGFPSVGKSTLLNKLTNAESKVAAYDFTTLTCIPGAMEYEGADIQLLDLPGIIKGASEGKGRGKEIFAALRFADLIMIILDAKHPGHLDVIKKEVYEIGLRLNKKEPDVQIKRTSKGGINLILSRNVKKLEGKTIKAMLNELKIINADVIIREDIDEDDLVDVIAGNRVYVPAMIVLNKVDLIDKEKLEQLKHGLQPDICISAQNDTNLDELKRMIFERLNLMRIYCKKPGKKADLKEALIIGKGSTLSDLCKKLHRDFVKRFRYARIWGSAKYPGLVIRGLDYELKDKDVVELHLR